MYANVLLLNQNFCAQVRLQRKKIGQRQNDGRVLRLQTCAVKDDSEHIFVIFYTMNGFLCSGRRVRLALAAVLLAASADALRHAAEQGSILRGSISDENFWSNFGPFKNKKFKRFPCTVNRSLNFR
jgi:hypothetical protein